MEFKGFMGWFYVAADWITKLAYVNLLWVVFTLLGGIVLGIMPATVAMFATLKAQLQTSRESPVSSVFIQNYKQEFWKSNRLGMILVVVGALLVLDLRFFNQMAQSSLFLVLKYITVGILAVYLFTVMYVFPVFVTYKMPLSRILQVSIFIAATRPIRSILMLIFGFAFTFILSFMHALFILFIGSGLAILMLLNATGVFKTLDRRFFPER